MFVERVTNNHRIRIGSMDAAQDLRLAANGTAHSSALLADTPANENVLPVAPVDTGLLGNTRVNTPNGPIAIEDLVAGQTILTSTGGHERLSHVIPAETPKSALRIRAPYFGASHDFIIGTNQFLEIRSEIAEYMFGEACVCVPAWAFKDNSKVVYYELNKSDRMFQLQIDASDGVGVGDCHVTPLLVGAKSNGKRFLSDAEARAFATERRIGQYN